MSNKSWQHRHDAWVDSLSNLNAKKGGEETVPLPGAGQWCRSAMDDNVVTKGRVLQCFWLKDGESVDGSLTFTHLRAQIPGCDIGDVQPPIQSDPTCTLVPWSRKPAIDQHATRRTPGLPIDPRRSRHATMPHQSDPSCRGVRSAYLRLVAGLMGRKRIIYGFPMQKTV
jgi:hypothetical protein